MAHAPSEQTSQIKLIEILNTKQVQGCHGVCSQGCSVGVTHLVNLTCRTASRQCPTVLSPVDCQRSVVVVVVQVTDHTSYSIPSHTSCPTSQREEPSLEADYKGAGK